jgi:hypothetical protein
VTSPRAEWTRAIERAYLTDEEYEAIPIRANKYHAQVCTVDGIRFDSRKEARRYEELMILVAAGEILWLELQPEFAVTVKELWRDPGALVVCGRFRADFRYVETRTGEVVIEDTKSGPTKTTAYRLRKRLVEAIHGVTIREV